MTGKKKANTIYICFSIFMQMMQNVMYVMYLYL